ncbi:MAG: helix-turn-helix transcriptional regulator [Planctomycetota bacterium]
MPKFTASKDDFPSVEIQGQRYFMVPEPDLEALLAKGSRKSAGKKSVGHQGLEDFAVDDLTLAQRLRRRREEVGLTQLDLATRAGLRHETLNRIERGKTTPDFRTIRKLVIAMDNLAASKGTPNG